MATKTIRKSATALLDKKYCAQVIGLKGCVKVAVENAAFIRDIALYKLAGKHLIAVSVKPGN